MNDIGSLYPVIGFDGSQMNQNTPAAFHGRPEAAEQLTQELREVLRSSP